MLGGAGGGLTGILGGLGGAVSGAAGSIGGLLTGALGSLGGAVSGAVGGIGSMLGSLGTLAGAAGPVGFAVAGIGAAVFGLTKLFQDTKSAGTEAALAFQDFVSANVTGGAELAAAMQTNFDAMSQANFDYQTFLTATGTTFDQVFGGISANWQSGSTAMDLFTQAVAASGVEEGKAAQVALQMIASFQDMGMSSSEAGAKMLEIAQAAGFDQTQLAALQAALNATSAQSEMTAGSLTGLSGAEQAAGGSAGSASGAASGFTAALQQLASDGRITQAQMDALSAAFGSAGNASSGTSGDVAGLRAALADVGVSGKDADALIKAFAASLDKIPASKTVKIKVEQEGKIPAMASGGTAPGGLTLYGERGVEGAIFPSGLRGIIGVAGPEIGWLPAGTQVIPHHRLSPEFLLRLAQPMASGGVVQATPVMQITNQITITGNTIDQSMDLDALATELSRRLETKIRAAMRAW